MDLRAYLLELLPVGVGEELAPGARLVDASTELGLRLTFLVGERQEIHVEVSPLSSGLPHAAASQRLAFGYRSGGEERVDAERGLALCRLVAAAARAREEDVLERIAADALRDRADDTGSIRVREVRVDRLLEPAGDPEKRFYTLSPYVGCLIGCRFCYAQTRLDPMRDLLRLPVVPWGSYVDVRTNAADVLAAELAERAPRPIKFCPIVSDPYQAVEKKHGITRRCLEVIRDAGDPFPTIVMTRSDLVLRDVDVIRDIPLAWVGASIPTIDDRVRAHFEPRAAPIERRLEVLRELRAAGVATGVVIQPMLPGSAVALADALAEVVTSASLDVLHGVHGAADDFAAPEHAHAAADAWQRERALELRELLVQRGIAVWADQFPPEVEQWFLSNPRP